MLATTKRGTCPSCFYPIITCVCYAVKPILCKTQFDILQHPSEVKAAKNTARLCQLGLPKTNIWLGESAEDFSALQGELSDDTRKIVLLYPGEDALAITDLIHTVASTKNKTNTKNCVSGGFRVLLLDGTWKKTYKLMKLNKWLQQYPRISLTNISTMYDIRKSPSDFHLSTIEALAHTLIAIEPDRDIAPLLRLFDAMQNNFRKYRPKL